MAFCHPCGVWMYECREWYSPVCLRRGFNFMVCVCLRSRLGMCECLLLVHAHACLSSPRMCIYPVSLCSWVCEHSDTHMCVCVCVRICVSICVQPHFLCACWSILAFGEKDAVHSPQLLCFQHWIRDGVMICGNDFLNAANLCLPFLYPILLEAFPPNPSPPERENPPCCVRLMKDKKRPPRLTLSHRPSEDCTNLLGS